MDNENLINCWTVTFASRLGKVTTHNLEGVSKTMAEKWAVDNAKPWEKADVKPTSKSGGK